MLLRYILERLRNSIPVIILVVIIIGSLIYLAPGDPALVIAGDTATGAEIEAIREVLGLNQSYLKRMVIWFGQVVQGDLGLSIYSGVPVTRLIAQAFWPTLSLTVFTMSFTLIIAVPLGWLAATRAKTWVDRVLMLVSVLGFSVPVFVIGYSLILVFGINLRWLPVQGYVTMSENFHEYWRHLLAPSFSLAIVYIALVARISRASILDVINQDYVRTAKAKGLHPITIGRRYIIRNAAIPIVTIIGIGIGLLMTGVVVTETVFNIHGLGHLVVDAILQRDYPVIQGVTLIFSLIYIAVNLAVDISYIFFDPRIEYS